MAMYGIKNKHDHWLCGTIFPMWMGGYGPRKPPYLARIFAKKADASRLARQIGGKVATIAEETITS